MTVREAVELLDERKKQRADANANLNLWRRQLRVAQLLVEEAENEVKIAIARHST